MIRAIVWKEFREQGLIGLTLLVLGTGVLFAAAAVAEPRVEGAGPADVVRYLGLGRLATLLLAVTAGMVCGGALFAGEREAGTMGFLDALPTSRWRVWRAKLAAGSALMTIQVGVVLAVAAALGLVEGGSAVAIGLYALLAFTWGLYGSTHARTTLGSVGVAIPTASFVAIATLVPVTLFFHNPGNNLPRAEGQLIFLAVMLAAPLAGSALSFTRPDRERAADDPTPILPRPTPRTMRDFPDPPPEPEVVPSQPGRSRVGVRAAAWLAARQLVRPGLALSAFALAFGLALLLPGVQPVLLWPGLALAAGILAGVSSFADEQAHGVAMFWGERRLPVGRAWAVKVAVYAGFALWLAALLALPLAVRSQVVAAVPGRGEATLSAVFKSLLFEPRHFGPDGWKYLAVPVGYGFAFGHLCGLLLRKAVVSAGVAVLVGGTAAALWFPSVLAGGVGFWQLWLPPILVLVTARLLLRPWSAERLGRPAALGTLAAGGGAVALALAAGVGYRAAEVRDEPGGEDDLRYVAGLLPFDTNEAGRGFRTAAEQYARVAGRLTPATDRTGPPGARRGRVEERADAVLYKGYRGDDPEFDDWLTRVYESDRPTGADPSWYAAAAAAADPRLPVGLYEHPLVSGTTTGAAALDNGRRMAVALLAHGLRRQATGDPAAFVDDLRTALAVGRNMRNGSVVRALQEGNTTARQSLAATDRWLEQLDGRPDLLRAALAAVLADDRAVPTRVTPDGAVVPAEVPAADGAVPFDAAPYLLAERFLIREAMKAPTQWLPDQLASPGADREAAAPVVDLVSFAWSVPWERERTRRLVGMGFERAAGPQFHRLTRGRPGAAGLALRTPSVQDLTEFDRQLRVYRRAVALRLAVRLYWADRGTVPPDLDAVVAAGILPAVPTDPYADPPAPFHYRVSEGETFAVPRERIGPTTVPPTIHVGTATKGQPIVWSVGQNKTDDGGRSLPVAPGNPSRAEDLVYLVPPPPARK